ncbi:hypothetical protein EBT16_04390, partial [bacterium]|nr:hypothetical protein [bacterium]
KRQSSKLASAKGAQSPNKCLFFRSRSQPVVPVFRKGNQDALGYSYSVVLIEKCIKLSSGIQENYLSKMR